MTKLILTPRRKQQQTGENLSGKFNTGRQVDQVIKQANQKDEGAGDENANSFNAIKKKRQRTYQAAEKYGNPPRPAALVFYVFFDRWDGLPDRGSGQYVLHGHQKGSGQPGNNKW